MNTRQVRLLAFAVVGLAALALAACSNTRLSQSGSSTGPSGGFSSGGLSSGATAGGSCAAGQIPIPGGPPDGRAASSSAGSSAAAGGTTTGAAVTMAALNGIWTVTDGSQTCGCRIELAETQLGVSGTAFSNSCQSSWLQQTVRFEYRNSGRSVAFFNGAGNVLYELQVASPNVLVGFAFGQRLTIFR